MALNLRWFRCSSYRHFLVIRGDTMEWPRAPLFPFGISIQPIVPLSRRSRGEADKNRLSFQRELGPTQAHRRSTTHHSSLRLPESGSTSPPSLSGVN